MSASGTKLTFETGAFCWNELATTDPEAAKRFYGEIFGWQYMSGDVEGTNYTQISVGNRPVGGIYQTESGGSPPHWMAYVSVKNVDETVRRAEELGGKICVPPTDIPNTGRFAVINDPTGATISVITLSGM